MKMKTSIFKFLKLTEFENRTLQIIIEAEIESLECRTNKQNEENKEFLEAKICILQNILEKLTRQD